MKAVIFWIFTSVILLSISLLLGIDNRIIQVTVGLNGTCVNGNLTKGTNQSMNISGLSDEYLKNLTTDNTQLANIICQPILNGTAEK